MIQLKEIFQVKINENKLQKTLQYILIQLRENREQIQYVKNSYEKINHQYQAMNSLVDCTALKIQKKHKEDIQRFRMTLNEEIYCVRKQIRKQNKETQEKIDMQIQNLEKQISKFRQGAKKYNNQQNQALQKRLHEQFLANRKSIKQCEKALVQLCSDNIKLYNNILNNKSFKVSPASRKANRLKRENSHLLKQEEEQNIIKIYRQPSKDINIDIENSQIQKEKQINFSQIIDTQRNQLQILGEQFKKYIHHANFKGNRENDNLMYAVLSEKVKDIQESIKNIKEQQHMINCFHESIKYPRLQENAFEEIQKLGNVKKSMLSIPPSFSNLSQAQKPQYVRVQQFQYQLESFKTYYQDKLMKDYEKITDQLDKKLVQFKKQISKNPKKSTQTEKRKTNRPGEVQFHQVFTFMHKIQNQLSEKLSEFATKDNIISALKIYDSRMASIKDSLQTKSNKSETKEAFMFIEDKIKDLITVLASIQESKIVNAAGNKTNQCISCDKIFYENKDSNRSSAIGAKSFKSPRNFYIKSRDSSERFREVRRSDGIS